MASMPAEDTGIIGGVDTHQDLHTAAIVTLEGAVLGESFSTTRAAIPGDACLVPVSRRAAAQWGSNPPAATAPASPAPGAVRSARPRGDRSRPGRAKSQGKRRCTRGGCGGRGGSHGMSSPSGQGPRRRGGGPAGAAHDSQDRGVPPGGPAAAPQHDRRRAGSCATRSATSPACGACASARLGGRTPRDTGRRSRPLSLKSLARRILDPTTRCRTRPLHRSARRGTRTRCSSSKAWEPPVRASSWSQRARIPTGCAPKRASRCCAVPAHCPPRAVRRDATVSIAAGTARPTPPST